ncbi:MAG TPA: GntG family PLP-dependent aldolase [Candidatus Eisenbacteria bacterium]
MTYVDLRSDTVTRPTQAMRRAMVRAEVGDDVFGEDPTVRELEEETAAILGKEASLFVPSGCMGNEIAVAVHTRAGDSIFLDRFSHIVQVEARAILELLGRRFLVRDGNRGRMTPEEVDQAEVNGESAGGRIGLVEVENTHNWGSGAIYPAVALDGVAQAARRRGLPVHLDGARIWNASVATGTRISDFAAGADSVMVCYSKGLGAPVGSAVAGTKAFIQEARGARKMFGGAMRQAGIVAAAALYALRQHLARLAKDHARAKRLAEAFAETEGLDLDPREIETNIVIAELKARPERLHEFVRAVASEGALIAPFGGPGRFRAVTHLDVDDAGIDRAIRAVREASRSVLLR